MRKLIAGLLAFMIAITVSAQTAPYTVSLPQILPPSPEAAAFIKAGYANVNLSTGAATASIPLYDIKIKDFSFPLSLSYSTQGLKVDEASSRVGYGWVLNATGMITRTVRDKPDELTHVLTIPADVTVNTDPVFNYFINASDPSTSAGDAQQDEFQFNFNGYSGKFVLDASNNARVTATSNLKVTVNLVNGGNDASGSISTIVIITPDGVKYTFGNAYEQTTTHTIQEFLPFKTITKTAFFLDRIDLPSGDNIGFFYTPVHIGASTGTVQTLQVNRSGAGGSCNTCGTMTRYTTNENKVEYNTNYLSEITTSTGMDIDFTYETRPDLSGDKRLKTLVAGNSKKYLLNYYDVPSTTVTTGRFFLTQLRDATTDGTTGEDANHDYNFTYDQMSTVPLPVSFNQDYLGYYNGTGNTYLIPPTVNSSNTIDYGYREPHSAYSKRGTLTSIQYPTGGRQDYTYEANTVSVSVLRNTTTSVSLAGPGGTTLPVVYNSPTFTILMNQTIRIHTQAADANPSDGFTQNPMAPTVIVKLYEGATVVASRSSLGYTPDDATFNALAGHTYKLQITVNHSTEVGSCDLFYDYSDHPIYDLVNQEGCGVRVKQITATDPITQNVNSKYYTYAALSDLTKSTGSGSVLSGAIFHSVSTVRLYCDVNMATPINCTLDLYSSNSTNDVYSNAGSGSQIYYSKVIESDDPAFVNGGTEYSFAPNDNGGNHFLLLGQEPTWLPTGQYPTLSGTVLNTRHFNSAMQIVQEELNVYETQIDMSNAVISMYVRRRFEVPMSALDRMDAFDVVRIQYNNTWNRLKTKTTTSYAGGVTFSQVTNYGYGTIANVLPATLTTTDSKNLTLVTENKYPTDFSGDAVCAKLIARNIVSPVIQQSSYRNAVLLQQKKTLYKDWFSDTKILQPEIIQLRESPSETLHNSLVFSKYDYTGNVIQLKKVGDMSLVYLWDTLHCLPICEVKNATADQVAFSSFETGSKGNWVYAGATSTAGGSITGGFSYSLPGGAISKTGLTAGNVYKVSYWTKNAVAYTIAGNTAGYPKQGKTINGWTYFEHRITGQTSVTISGTNYIDEVRLYPDKALMNTYTYAPFIGITSQCDANNKISYYQYDGFARLSVIKDQDNNIIKKMCYNYLGHQNACFAAVFYNDQYSQTLSRNNCPAGYTAGSVTYIVPANKYAAATKVAANLLAQNDLTANAQNYANANGTCTAPVSNITMTSKNWVGISGFTAKYTNTVTGTLTTLTVSATSGVQPLGTLPSGTYNVVISKPGNSTPYWFSVCTSLGMSGTSGTFSNVTVSSGDCNYIQINLGVD